jgi:hypothetical protein
MSDGQKKKKKRVKTFLAVFKCPDCDAVNDSQQTNGDTAMCEVCGCDSTCFNYRCPSCDALNPAPPTRSSGSMWCEVCGYGRSSSDHAAAVDIQPDLNPSPTMAASAAASTAADSTPGGGRQQQQQQQQQNKTGKGGAASACAQCSEYQAKIQETRAELEAKVQAVEKQLLLEARKSAASDKDSAESIDIMEKDLRRYQDHVNKLSGENESLHQDLRTLQASLMQATEAKDKFKSAYENGEEERKRKAAAEAVAAASPSNPKPSTTGHVRGLEAANEAASVPLPKNRAMIRILLLVSVNICLFVAGGYLSWLHFSSSQSSRPPSSQSSDRHARPSSKCPPPPSCPACPKQTRYEVGGAATEESGIKMQVSQCERREASLEKRLFDAEKKASSALSARDACEDTRRSAELLEASAKEEASSMAASLREAQRQTQDALKSGATCQAKLEETSGKLADALARGRKRGKLSGKGVGSLDRESDIMRAQAWARFV